MRKKRELIKERFLVIRNVEGFGPQNLTLVMVKPGLIVKRFGACHLPKHRV